MTQIVTVSALTAAYAMEAIKPAARVPRKQRVEEAVRAFEAACDEDAEPADGAPVIRAASAELSMMNFSDQHPHATFREALDAYRDSSE